MTDMRFAIVALLLVGASVAAETEIHRCVLENGTIAFQETPCPEPDMNADDDSEIPAADDNVFDFVSPFDEPSSPATPIEPTQPERASKDRAECEKTTRDAIDAIDLEMRKNTYSKEQGQEYLAELLELTQQLRACKQL